MIACQALTHQFSPRSEPVLKEINFEVEAGEFVSILGPSGCGKSTILKLLAGLIVPSQGQLMIDGQQPTSARRAKVGYVFQEPRLLPWRTVVENLRLPGVLEGAVIESATIAQRLGLVGLTEADGHKLPHMLSGGMKMRVSLARALLGQPRIMLFDEPFAALDEMLRELLDEELNRLWLSGGWSGLFVTHNISEAVFLSQRVLIMSPRPGRIVEEVTVDLPRERHPELKRQPQFHALVDRISTTMREIYRAGVEGAQ